MPKGPLRLAVEDWLFTTANPEGGPGFFDRVKARWKAYWLEFNARVSGGGIGLVLGHILYIPGGLVYAIFGVTELLESVKRLDPDRSVSDGGPSLKKLIQSAIESPDVQSMASIFGEEIAKPIRDLFFEYAGRDDVDPQEFVDRLEGLLSVLNASGAIADIAAETLTLGQFQSVGNAISRLYRSLGLDTLKELAWRPFVTHGLHPTFERFYLAQYRPARFRASELRDLFALGEITADEMRNNAQLEGWRDQDIEKWLKLAFRDLNEGDTWQAYHEGFIDENRVTLQLRKLGYNPADIPLLFKLNPKKETNEAKDFTVSTARTAFKDGLIGENELREILRGLKYQDREIDLVVAIDRMGKQAQDKTLSASQIKAAWQDNVLSDQEATHWLQEAGFQAEQIKILVSTWKAEVTPTYRKLNLATLTGAYVEGILNRVQTRDRLTGIGFSVDDANLELDLVEKRNPEAFGRPPAKEPKALTAGTLDNLVYVGLITPLQMQTRLQALGYTETDAALLAEAARIRAIPQARQLSQSTLENAFFAGLLTRDEVFQRLKELGFRDRDANLTLDLVQQDIDKNAERLVEAQIKRLSPGNLEQLVIAGLLTGDEMFSRLREIGYSENDAGLLTGRAVSLAAQPPRVLNQGTILQAYLVGVFNRDQTLTRILELGFTPEDTAAIVVTFEQSHPEVFNPDLVQAVRLPSIGALVSALQKEIITEQEYYQKTAELGYSPGDAKIYIGIATTVERKSTRLLTPSQLTNAYGAGLLPYNIVLQRLTQNGYSEDDAILLIRLEKDLLENSEAWTSLLQGEIGPFDAIAQLINARYSDQDILDAFTALGPVTLSQMGIDIPQLAEALHATPGGE